MNSLKKYLFLTAGLFSLALGFIGLFLPILPTTPFMILAAYCFSKSSARLYQWLLKRPHIGKMILDWQNHGVIKKKAKVASTLVIIPLFSYTFIFVQVFWGIKLLLIFVAFAVLYFIWSRPSFSKEKIAFLD
jgi:hypothetical protein